ncbi:MAG: hypothetical protein KC482_09930 [Dehalococcoidia bacterium]|nr:hypothetical protein [Dehalococcoidia bacterium]MCA9826276.1 hypothetical protein [Dehalococcoidia bacterium]MCA9845953.1 hypothetical protein [Dehalococcoidia bacterium]MCA9853899.1 hypothetical protein [Dehalococcoidia bacterium]
MNEVQRHPVGGAFSGLALGLGFLVMVFIYGLAWSGTWWPYAVVLVLFIIGGALIGLFAPPWRRRG